MSALIIGSESQERSILALAMAWLNNDTSQIESPKAFTSVWQSNPADLIFLLDNPSYNTCEIVREIRRNAIVPLLLITDRTGEYQHVELYDAGCDQVITRPFSPRILARIARSHLLHSTSLPLAALPTIKLANIVLSPPDRTIRIAGQPEIRLSQLEFAIVHLLIINRGRLLTAEHIGRQVWQFASGTEPQLVRGVVQRIRKKIEPDPSQPRYLQTGDAGGYRWTIE